MKHQNRIIISFPFLLQKEWHHNSVVVMFLFLFNKKCIMLQLPFYFSFYFERNTHTRVVVSKIALLICKTILDDHDQNIMNPFMIHISFFCQMIIGYMVYNNCKYNYNHIYNYIIIIYRDGTISNHMGRIF
jgi:hypothetical protein